MYSESITHTEIRLCTILWCVWRKIFRCAIHLFAVKETLDLSMATQRRRTDIQKQNLKPSRKSCWLILKKKPWTSFQTLTARTKSQKFFLRNYQTCLSTEPWELRLVWRPTFRHTTSAKF